MVYKVRPGAAINTLFDGWEETMIWSCLQGVMGHLYADSISHPKSAKALLGDFCFLAGEPSAELVLHKPDWCRKSFLLMTAESPEWFPVIEGVYADRAKKVSRYAIKKEKDVFDQERLLRLANEGASEYQFRWIDRELYHLCLRQDWSKDLVSTYEDYAEYERLGLGILALKDGIPVSGASSYSRYADGIEIEIDTRKDHRRKGLAAKCGAKLILECLKRGLYPSWDAQNMWSVRLAEKLGYHFDREYTAYEIHDY